MKPSSALATHRSEIREIVLAHRAVNARVFGSIAQGLDTDLSDLGILVNTRRVICAGCFKSRYQFSSAPAASRYTNLSASLIVYPSK